MSHKGAHSISQTNGAGLSAEAVAKATAADIARLSAIRITEPLTTAQARGMKKPYAGHVAILSRALSLLSTSGLRVSKIDAAALQSHIVERERVAAIEAALAPVARSAQDQRLALDHQMMSALYKVARTARAAEDDELQAEWSFLTDYLSQYGKMAARAKAARKAAQTKAEATATKK
jgi:hypothetical protein